MSNNKLQIMLYEIQKYRRYAWEMSPDIEDDSLLGYSAV
jgi:hypothetical protein